MKRYDIIVFCHWCRKEFEQRIDTVVRQAKKYGHTCCKNCFGKEPTFSAARSAAMKLIGPGRKHSEETKAKLSSIRMGKAPWNKGTRKYTPSRIIKQSVRREVIERDCNSCWKCGGNTQIEVHHIAGRKQFPEGTHDPDNCIALCRKCHLSFHRIYGRYKFTPTHTIEWLNDGREEKDFVLFN